MHLRRSSERQENLRAYAYNMLKADNIRVNLDETAETASIQNYGQDDTPTIITVPTFDATHVENPFPDVDDEVFYALLHYAEIEHEGGHYLYTDEPSVERNFDALRSEVQVLPRAIQPMVLQLGRDLWNAIEDGAMEEALRNERGPKTAQWLAVKNETFIAQGIQNYPDERRQNVTFDLALHLAAMDLAKFNTGALRRLLDEEDPSWQFATDEHEEIFMDLYPALRQTIEDAFTIPSNAARTDRIFGFITDEIIPLFEQKVEEVEQADTSDRDQLRRGQTDDSENQIGPAQQRRAEGLQQNSKQEVAKKHAQMTMQPVESDSVDSDGESGSDGSDGAESGDETGESSGSAESSDAPDVDGESGTDGDASADGDGSSGEASESGDSNSNTDSATGSGSTGSEELGAGGDASDEEMMCPDCGATDVGRLVQTVDGMIAARVNAPFSLTAPWVGSITFVSNDELCGFRVQTTGDVPVQAIEQDGYKVVDVGSDVIEILEPKARYGESEQVNGFECESCGHAWVPVIGGDSV